MLTRMITNEGATFEFQGRKMKGGDEFEVPEDDVQRWEVYGLATRAPKRSPGRPRKSEHELAQGEYNRSDLRVRED